MVQWNDTLFVGLQRLDRNAGFEPLSSVVLQIDCSSFEILEDWQIGSNISMVPWDDGVALVSQQVDGQGPSIYRWHEVEEAWQKRWEAEEYLSSVRLSGDRLFYSSSSPEFSSYRLHCVDLETDEHQQSDNVQLFVTDLWLENSDTGWFSAHWGWMDVDSSQPGLYKVDLQSCSINDYFEMEMAPYSMAFIPE